MNLFYKLLNQLSLYKFRDSSSHLAGAIAFILLAVVFSLCWMMSAKVERKMVFTIDEYTLGGAKSVTFGENSDFCVKNVPHDFLTVTYQPKTQTFKWSVGKQFHDTLQYFKINGENPNKHVIRNDERQVVELKLPTPDGKTLETSFTGADVWKAWDDFKEQKNVMARHLATYLKLAGEGATHQDSVSYLSQMQVGKVRSFFNKEGDNLVLVILDEMTTLTTDGKKDDYNDEGEAPLEDGRFKVQFFGLADWCYMDGGNSDDYFRVDGVNYVMKPAVKLTEWGAGHATIIPSQEGLRITFPRPITYVESVDSLKTRAEKASKILTIKQLNNSYPTKSDLYLPAFSSAINFDLCNIEFFHQKDSICIKGNNDKAQLVKNPASVIPALGKMTLHSGKDTMKCRVGFIKGSFIMGYLWLPLAVLVVLLMMTWLKVGPVYVRNTVALYNPKHIANYRPYLSMLLICCMAYCVCKSLITLKLSYSYPYFEKLTGIMPFSTSLMMLLFFSLAMLFNTPLRLYATDKKPMRRMAHWMVCALLFAGLGFLFFFVADKQVSQSIIDSYFHDEVFKLNPFEWMKTYGINDTHRSVVYALLAVEFAVLVLWLLADWMWKWLSTKWESMENSWQKKTDKMARWINNKWQKKGKKYPDHLILAAVLLVLAAFMLFHMGFSWLLLILSVFILAVVCWKPFVTEAFFAALRSLFPTHVILFIILYAIGKFAGNFGTAFITLVVILGMTRALTSVNMYEGKVPGHVIFCQMFFISLAYIMAAMISDHGYMTNYLGFAMCVFCFYFLMKRPTAYDEEVYQKMKEEKRWAKAIPVVLLVLMVAMPFVCSLLFSPEKVNYDRFARRVMLYSNFDDLEKSGYRYSESDAEFMVIMSHYMRPAQGRDPLSNDNHFLHTSISSGQSPVVLNDLSMPAAFFGTYGIYLTSAVYFLLLFIIMWMVMQFSLSYYDKDARLTRAMQWRLLAMMMWVGTSFYIYLSYVGRLPFTGRLNPGFGVDAVGEALETAFLLAFMAAVTCRGTIKKYDNGWM
ncbi:MAG: hypothetical protein IKH88_01405 [Prevotella sp.]|nr:hypothetical protein [Prevotella sp.]